MINWGKIQRVREGWSGRGRLLPITSTTLKVVNITSRFNFPLKSKYSTIIRYQNCCLLTSRTMHNFTVFGSSVDYSAIFWELMHWTYRIDPPLSGHPLFLRINQKIKTWEGRQRTPTDFSLTRKCVFVLYFHFQLLV